MNSNDQGDDPEARVIAFSFFCSLLTAAIAWLHPYESPISERPPIVVQFTFALSQAIWLVFPGVLTARLVAFRRPAIGYRFGVGWSAMVPIIVSLDIIADAWFGQRLISETTLRILGHWNGLRDYIRWNTLGVIIGALASCLAALWVADWLTRRIVKPRRRLVPTLALLLLSIALAIPAVASKELTAGWFHQQASRNPLRVIAVWEQITKSSITARKPAELETNDDFERDRSEQFRQLAIVDQNTAKQATPDILIVIVESMRSELIDSEVMPHLHRYATNGIWCQQHFSGGNATTHGMFSLVNGLEASWYDSPVRFTPLLNRLFRSQGYEIGFFAGHGRWSEFYMDAFLSEDHFDTFDVIEHNGLGSDRYATMRAAQFLDEPSEERPPRIAILYLYATHAIYSSYPKDQVFQPAADDRYLFPYTPSMRERVWNRYRNSARTIDRFLASIMNERRIMIVTGDHGEAFLEDGTIGHGTRISRVQNATHAVIWIPDGEQRVIQFPSMHADILPTLVDAIGWKLNQPEWLSGTSLLQTDVSLSNRTFATRDYLSDTYGLIGPWTTRSDQPFALTFQYHYDGHVLTPSDAVDEFGNSLPDESGWLEQLNTWRRP